MTSTPWVDQDRQLEALLSELNAQRAQLRTLIDALGAEVQTTVDGNGGVISSRAVAGRTRHQGPEYLAQLIAVLDTLGAMAPEPESPYTELADGVGVEEADPEPLKPPSWDPLGVAPWAWNLVDDLPEARMPVMTPGADPAVPEVGLSGREYPARPRRERLGSVVLMHGMGLGAVAAAGMALACSLAGDTGLGVVYAGIGALFLLVFGVHQRTLSRFASRPTGLQAAPCVWCNETTILGVDAARTIAAGRQFLVCKPCQSRVGLLSSESRSCVVQCQKCRRVEFCSTAQIFALEHKCFECYAKSKKRRSFAKYSALNMGADAKTSGSGSCLRCYRPGNFCSCGGGKGFW